ncbi:MAG: tRNA pseudouridine(55) synthase TruB [Alphaproteobacteria bacterium]
MGRRSRKGDPVHGWVIVDKPKDVTSTQVVGIVRRAFNAQKAGHGGTLDPLASGVLPIALGEATKTVPYTMDALKAYEFTVRFGEERNTDDLEGEITHESDVRPSRDALIAALPDFVGDVEQVPPRFSAIKVKGERAYDLARSGEEVELKSRSVYIERLEFIDWLDPSHAKMRMICGKGTYVRSLARDLGRKLGTFGTIADIRRTMVGPFDAADATPLLSLKDLGDSPPPQGSLHPVEMALDGIPALSLVERDAQRLRSGNPVRMTRLMAADLAPFDREEDPVIYATSAGKVVALAEIAQGEVRPVRVFNL